MTYALGHRIRKALPLAFRAYFFQWIFLVENRRMRLSKDIINSRLKDRGIVLMSGFTKRSAKALFKFKCGCIKSVLVRNVLKGVDCQKHTQRKPVYGVGINDDPGAVSNYSDGKKTTCPIYSRWVGVLGRCFSDELHEREPTYKGCTIDDDWLLFSNFKRWMKSQDWSGKHLDKDILGGSRKHYGEDTCIFIEQSLNNLLTNIKRTNGVLPTGVFLCKKTGRYGAKISVYAKIISLGHFSTPEVAEAAYLVARSDYLMSVAGKQKDKRVRDSLINLAAYHKDVA